MPRYKEFFDEIDNTTLKDNLEKYRISKNLNKTDLAYRLGYGVSTLVGLYANRSRPSKRFWKNLLDETGKEKKLWLEPNIKL